MKTWVDRFSSTLQQKSRDKNLEKGVKSRDYRCKKVGIVGLFKNEIHHNDVRNKKTHSKYAG